MRRKEKNERKFSQYFRMEKSPRTKRFCTEQEEQEEEKYVTIDKALICYLGFVVTIIYIGRFFVVEEGKESKRYPISIRFWPTN